MNNNISQIPNNKINSKVNRGFYGGGKPEQGLCWFVHIRAWHIYVLTLIVISSPQ